jgi:hypothetical protein
MTYCNSGRVRPDGTPNRYLAFNVSKTLAVEAGLHNVLGFNMQSQKRNKEYKATDEPPQQLRLITPRSHVSLREVTAATAMAMMDPGAGAGTAAGAGAAAAGPIKTHSSYR